MAAVLWLDFDGVAVDGDLTGAILEEFGGNAWREAQEALAAGEISVEQAHARGVSAFEAEREAVEDRVRALAQPRDGFADLVGWAQWHGWLPVVVTTSFDVCVDTVLDELGLDRVTRHCGRSRTVYRWRLAYQSPKGIEIEERFLLAYANAFARAGDLVVHVGADAGGADAASSAFAVFAASGLADAIGGAETRLHTFHSLAEVQATLDREAEAWRASFGAATA